MLRILIALLLSVFLMACDESANKENDPNSYESIEKLIPTGDVTQQQKDTWFPFAVALEAVDDGVLGHCDVEGDCESIQSPGVHSAPDMSACEFVENFEDGTGDTGVGTDRRTIVANNDACPITLDYLDLTQVSGSQTEVNILVDTNATVTFKSNAGWPITFNLASYNRVGKVRTNAVQTSNTEARFNVQSSGHVELNTRDGKQVFARMAVRAEGEYFSGELLSSSMVLFVEGEGMDFGGKAVIANGVATYTINNQPATEEEWDALFGASESHTSESIRTQKTMSKLLN